jgi:protein-disulfide isomerase
MKLKYLYFVAIIAIFIGGLVFQTSKPQPQTGEPEVEESLSPPEEPEEKALFTKEELANMTLSYVSKRFLSPQGVEGELVSIEEYGEGLYVVNLRGRAGNQVQNLPPVYVTKDGKMILIGEGGGIVDITKEPETPAPTPQPQISRVEVSPDDDPSLGPEDAPVTVIEFSDFQCPYCSGVAGYNDEVIARMISKDPSWVAPVPKLRELAKQGKIRFVYRDFPLSFHQFAQKAAEASECAHEQGKYWEMHDKIFQGQGEWSRGNATDIFKRYASEVGLDKDEFDACLDSGKYASEVQKDLQDGTAAGVTGTPAFFINGISIKGAQSFSVFQQVIEAELSGEPANPQARNSETCPG